MSLKDRISSPLEAGTSILDAHHLPPHVIPALEYASNRLARRSLHATLIVVRRDYQLPTEFQPPQTHDLATPITPASPPTGRFNLATGRVSALKQLVRSASSSRLQARSESVPPLSPWQAAFRSRQNAQETRAFTPTTPLSPPPMTPGTASSTTTDTMSSMPAASFGMRFIQAGDLPAGARKTLRETLIRAEKAYGTGTEWLAPAIEPCTYGLTNQLVQSSIIQNEVLFASHGLTLLALDRVYSLKSALSSYSKTRSPLRLEDAVDELRRLVLARNGIKIAKAQLFRSYDCLSISDSALNELDRMYRRAYGGPEQAGAISGMPAMPPPEILEPVIRNDDDDYNGTEFEFEDDVDIPDELIGIAVSTPEKPKPPSPRGPALKLQTNFDVPPKKGADEEPDSERTARPGDFLPIMLGPGASFSIDEVLSAGILSPVLSPSARIGPMTPNGYEDISPTTRGEWGFLLVDQAFQGTKTAAVETW